MKIGHLNGNQIGLMPQITYTRIGGKIPLQPTVLENGQACLDWKSHHATGVELCITLKSRILLASLSLSLGDGSTIEGAELFDTEGRCVGACHAENSKALSGCVQIESGARSDRFVLRLLPTLTDLVVDKLDLYGAVLDEISLYPSPSAVNWRNGTVKLQQLTQACHDKQADSAFAAAYFAELTKSRWGLETIEGEGLVIAQDASMPQDAYRLTVTENGARLCASTRLGLLYAIERLFELEKEGVLPCCEIEDTPYKEMRGVHLFLPAHNEIPFFRSLIKNVLIPFHYNQLFIEFAGGMRFDRHPEISEGWLEGNRRAKRGEIPRFPHGGVAEGELLEKHEVRALCDFARELGFELIPEVQSFGHVQYITFAHPDIAEFDPEAEVTSTDAREADVPPSLFYKHSYCPQNEKSYAIIHDIIDEIVEVVRPQRFVHCGHDEIYQMGLCPKCKSVPRDRLYEMHVRDLHDYLAGKGLRMMLWADMVQPVTKYQCFPALDRLPKDIVWLDFVWYFHLDKDIEENLLSKGYEIMVGNLYSSHFPRYEHRIKPLLGGEVSFWCLTKESDISREGKFFDLMYTAEMLWSKGYCEKTRLAYTALIAERLPLVRARLRGEAPLTPKLALNFEKDKKEFFYKSIKGVLLNDPLTVDVKEAVAGLRFLHTALYREKRVAWGELVQIGTYTVRYEDGTEIHIPVTYDGNVRCFKYRFAEPLPEPYYRHEGYVCAWEANPVEAGYAEDGTPVTLYALTWNNPLPHKKIDSITCHEHADSAAGLVLCDVELLKGE